MKTEPALTPQQTKIWIKALSSMDLKNYDYTIHLCQKLLLILPNFLDARKLARQAAIQKSKFQKKSVFAKFRGKSIIYFMRAFWLLKNKKFVALLPILEKILADDPYNAQANTLLHKTALKFMPPSEELAFFALETILEGHPTEISQMSRFATFCMKKNEHGYLRNPTRAVDLYHKILAMNPNNFIAIKGSKDAVAAQSIQNGGWEIANNYRDLLKNKDKALALEQQSCIFKSNETIANLIINLSATTYNDSQSIEKSRKIAELYEQKGDLDQAIDWYNSILNLAEGIDSSIAQKITTLKLRKFDIAFQKCEESLVSSDDQMSKLRYREDMEKLNQERLCFMLSEARERFKRNPSDVFARYELGIALMDAGETQEAIGHLQRARSNPSIRIKAMGKLGQCYITRKMYDLAIKTFLDAISEVTIMNSLKKDLLYTLGRVYDIINKKEEALTCYKQIYEVDYGYLDVSHRVESSY